MLQDKFNLTDGGLLAKLMLDLSLMEAIRARDGRISVGPTGYLSFRFKKMSLDDARESSKGSSAQVLKDGTSKEGPTTEVITGNNPVPDRQAEAEVNEVQME